jgi:replicative DNA helicase
VTDPVSWVDILSLEYLDEFERTQSGPVYAVPTIFPSWSRVCGDDGGGRGLARGWMCVVGGNPGRGKTLLTLLLAREALRSGERVAYVSMEMHHTQLAARLYAMATGADVHRLERGRFDPQAMQWVVQSLRNVFPTAGLLTNRGLLFSRDAVLEHMSKLREQGVRVFFVDYLQLIGLGDEQSINSQVTDVVTHLRAFAVQTGSLVVVVSQFNRTTSSNYFDTPRSQGLHGGMIVEACADQVLLLDHSRYESVGEAGAMTWAVLDKNRHGARAEIPMRWDFRNLTAREAMPDEVNEWPIHEKQNGKRTR